MTSFTAAPRAGGQPVDVHMKNQKIHVFIKLNSGVSLYTHKNGPLYCSKYVLSFYSRWGGYIDQKKASHSVIFSLPALKTPANQRATPPAFISTWCLKVKPLPGQIIHWLTGRLPKNHTFLLTWGSQGHRHFRGTFLIWGVWHQARMHLMIRLSFQRPRTQTELYLTCQSGI